MAAITHLINPPHRFSIVVNQFWYFTQDLLRTIEPLQNNRKWVWYVYKQHNNLVVGLEFQYKTSHSVIILYLKESELALVLAPCGDTSV